MSVAHILDLLKEYIILAIFIVLLFLFFYKIVYKKIMKGQKEIKTKKLITILIFISYIVIVFGATFLSRGNAYEGAVNLSLFSSYKEAYIIGKISAWRNIILNIMLFIPMGFLLPLLTPKLKKWYKTIGIGFAITLLIEIVQTITQMGIFEIDDIFNNTLGTIIGYSIINIIYIIINKEEKKKILVNILPLLLTIVAFTAIFIKYSTQEFGNLSIEATTKFNMKNIEIENNISDIDTNRKKANVYKTKIYTKEETDKIAKDIFEKSGDATDEIIDTIYYEETAIYSTHKQNLWINYLGGTYSYRYTKTFEYENSSSNTTYSYDEDGNVIATISQNDKQYIEDKETVLEKLREIGINLDYEYEYRFDKEYGEHIFTVNMHEEGNNITDGNLICTMEENGNYSIKNNLIKSDKYKEKEIISEEEAYKKIEEGKFKVAYENEINKIKINSVELDYMSDSKAYYQPVYKFEVNINDLEKTTYIYIPAIS